MQKYELMVVYDPFLEEADQTAELDKAQEQIKRRGGTVTNVDLWGKRRLAYPINKKLEGYYTLMNFEADGDGAQLAELERTLRLDEKVMRVMLIRIPDPKKPRKVKVKKPKPAAQANTEVQYGNAGRGYNDPMSGHAGSTRNQ